jgi:hypothetical protein
VDQIAEIEDVSGLVQRALNRTCLVTGVDRLRGGTKKGVYRIHLDDADRLDQPSVVVHSWADAENFWPAAEHDLRDPFTPETGYQRFIDAQRTLESIGVRTPRVLWSDKTHTRYPADVAVVEDLTGGTLEALYDSDPAHAEVVTRDLARNLSLMRAHRADTYGTLEQVA